MPNEQTAIRVEADTRGFESAMREISISSEQFASVFTSSLRGAVVAGRDFDDVLRGIARRISSMALSRALAPLENAIGGLLSGIALPAAPAGPAGFGQSGIFPQLANQAASVVFNVTSPDPGSFLKSEGQLTAMLARAVGRGYRSV